MIRFIFLVLFLFSFLLFGIPMLVIEWALGKCMKHFNQEASDYRCLRVVQWAFKVILWITGVKVTVIGKENVPDEPVLFIANHRSYFDILLTYSRCKRLTGYVAKKEMLRYPILRDWMKRLYCLFLDRDNPKEGLKSILEAIDHIKRNFHLHFPGRDAQRRGRTQHAPLPQRLLQDCREIRLRYRANQPE